MQFAAVRINSCAFPGSGLETCRALSIGSIQVKKDPTIICLRLKKHESAGIGNENLQFDAKLIDGASLKEKMASLEKFSSKNVQEKQYETFVKSFQDL